MGVWLQKWTSGPGNAWTFNNINLRRIVSALGQPTTKLMFEFTAHSSYNSVIDSASVGIRSGTTDDMTATPVPIKFNGGNASVTITAGEAIWSDEVSLSLTGSEALLVHTSLLQGAAANRSRASATGSTYYEYTSSDRSGDQNVTMSLEAAGHGGLTGIKIWVEPEDGWVTVWIKDPGDPYTYNAMNTRRLVPDFGFSGSKVRIRVKGQPSLTSIISAASIGPRSGSTEDFSAAPTAITFNGGQASVSIPGGGEAWSDAMDMEISPGDHLVHLSMLETSNYTLAGVAAAGGTGYWAYGASDLSQTQDVTMNNDGYFYGALVEVQVFIGEEEEEEELNAVGLPKPDDNGQEGTFWWYGDDAVYSPHYTPVDISVTSLWVYADVVTGSGAANIKAAIYADNGGVPGTILGTSEVLSIGEPAAGTWYEFVFATPVSLSGATLYHFAFLSDRTAIGFAHQFEQQDTSLRWTSGEGYAGGFSDNPTISGSSAVVPPFLRIEGAMAEHYPHLYQLVLEANGSNGWITVAELEFATSPGGPDRIDAVGATTYGSKQHTGGYSLGNLTDNNGSSVWANSSYTQGAANWSLLVEFHGDPGALVQYSVTGSPYSNETPTAWTLKAWDGKAWQTIDTQSGLTWSGGEKKSFSITVPAIAGQISPPTGGAQRPIVNVCIVG